MIGRRSGNSPRMTPVCGDGWDLPEVGIATLGLLERLGRSGRVPARTNLLRADDGEQRLPGRYYPGTEEAHTNPNAPARGVPQSPRWSVGLTHRAALGGTLTARELFFDVLWAPAVVGVYRTLSYGVASQWPYNTLVLTARRVSLVREAWSLSLVTCHAGFSRHGD